MCGLRNGGSGGCAAADGGTVGRLRVAADHGGVVGCRQTALRTCTAGSRPFLEPSWPSGDRADQQLPYVTLHPEEMSLAPVHLCHALLVFSFCLSSLLSCSNVASLHELSTRLASNTLCF